MFWLTFFIGLLLTDLLYAEDIIFPDDAGIVK